MCLTGPKARLIEKQIEQNYQRWHIFSAWIIFQSTGLGDILTIRCGSVKKIFVLTLSEEVDEHEQDNQMFVESVILAVHRFAFMEFLCGSQNSGCFVFHRRLLS